jgi:cytochrome c551/c552
MKYRKTALISFVILFLNFVMGYSIAHADEALAKSKNCMACHGVDNKLVGPSLKEISAKYKGDGAAADNLVAKVKAGGSGVWGNVPMPPNAAVSDNDIKTLVTWILSL